MVLWGRRIAPRQAHTAQRNQITSNLAIPHTEIVLRANGPSVRRLFCVCRIVTQKCSEVCVILTYAVREFSDCIGVIGATIGFEFGCMRRHSPAFFTLFLIGSLASTALAQHRRPVTAEQQQAHREAVARARARLDLLRDLESGRITVREAAHRAGGTLVLERVEIPDCIPVWDVRGLTNRSSLVIVGRPLAARVELTDDRRSIATTYSVQVDDTFKARQLPPFLRHVIVRVPGGRMDFPDGASAETRSGPPLALGERYVFFLDDERNAPPGKPATLPGTITATTDGGIDAATVVYTPHRVDRGVFHLQADRKIRSHAQDTSDRFHHYDGISEGVFLAEIRAAIAASRFCISCSSPHRVRF